VRAFSLVTPILSRLARLIQQILPQGDGIVELFFSARVHQRQRAATGQTQQGVDRFGRLPGSIAIGDFVTSLQHDTRLTVESENPSAPLKGDPLPAAKQVYPIGALPYRLAYFYRL
jgi:hypothetical protein